MQTCEFGFRRRGDVGTDGSAAAWQTSTPHPLGSMNQALNPGSLQGMQRKMLKRALEALQPELLAGRVGTSDGSRGTKPGNKRPPQARVRPFSFHLTTYLSSYALPGPPLPVCRDQWGHLPKKVSWGIWDCRRSPAGMRAWREAGGSWRCEPA
jgi:hypothetical protein